MLPVWRLRAPFAALLMSHLISVLGTAMSQLAIPWLVLTRTGSPGLTGLVGFAEMAPYVALQILAGPLVDRFGARRTCAAGNAAAALATAAIPLSIQVTGLHVAELAAIVAMAGALRGTADCASNVLVPRTASGGSIAMERAAGLSSTASRAGLLIGTPLGGVLVALVGAPAVVLLDAGTFAVAAVLVAGLIPDALTPAESPAQDAGYVRQLADGFRFLLADHLLLGIVVMAAITNLLDQGLTSVLAPVWVHRQVGNPAALGLIFGVAGGGSLIGSMAGTLLSTRFPRRLTFGIGYLLAGAPTFAVFALAGALPPVLIVILLAATAGGAVNPIIGATLYERTPGALQSRVLGTVMASAWLTIPFGSLLAGASTATLGLRPTLGAAAGIYLITTLAPFVLPAFRCMRRPR